ncbi:MAG: dTMP kinase [Lentisphaeria bacterium]|jgi:dTMP kinase
MTEKYKNDVSEYGSALPSTKKRGKFITLEGSEGVGKSTNLSFIRDSLVAHGIDVVTTREPGGTPLAEQLREILLAKRDEAFNPTAELLIMFAARAQHLSEVILPALAKGSWVLCDRFTDATFAYQGFGRGLDLHHIGMLETIVQQGAQPDKTFYLDIDVTIGLARAQHRAELDRFEQEQIAFFERVRAGYLARVAGAPARYVVIDASQTLSAVQVSIGEKLDELFETL